MTAEAKVFIVFPGAGNGAPDAAAFTDGAGSNVLETIYYPDWRETARPGYHGSTLAAALADEAERRVAVGPIRIIGISVGGHFGYAVAHELARRGRVIGGFTAVDTYFDTPPEPAIERLKRGAWSTLKAASPKKLSRYVRSLIWRRALRAQEARWLTYLGKRCDAKSTPFPMRLDPIVEPETNVHLIIARCQELMPTLANASPIAWPALHFRTAESQRDDEAWRRRIQGIEFITLPVTHDKLFDPAAIETIRPRFEAAARTWA